MADRTIGKVAVKVIPDTKDFRRDLKKELDEIEKTLDPIKIKVVLDAGSVLAEAKRLSARVQRALDDVTIEVGLDEDNTFEADLARMNAQLEEMSEIDWKAVYSPEVSESAWVRVRRALASLARERDVEFSPKLNNVATRALTTALDRLSGYRAGREFAGDLRKMLANLDLAIPKIASMATAVGGLGAALLSTSAYLFALSAALAQIVGGVLLALPGAFVSLGVAVGVAAVALSDFKKVLPDVVRLYGTLKQAISDAFWKRAEGPLRRMATELFPQIKRGLVGVSDAMGGFFGNLSESIRKILGGQLEGMFANVADGIKSLSAHTDAFATILGVLGRVGSQFFEDMMGALGDAADGWAKWLSEAEKTGKLKAMIDNAVRGLKNLWRIGAGLVGIFKDMADAAQRAIGRDVLGSTASQLERIRNITKSADFQKELVEVFVAARLAMSNISAIAGPALERALGNLANLISDVFPKAGAIIGHTLGGIADAFNAPGLLTGMRSFFDSVDGFVEALRPAMADVGEAIGAVLELVTAFVDTATPGVGRAIQNLAGWIRDLSNGLKPLVEGLGGALTDALDAIAPGVDKIVKAIADFAKGDGGKALVGFFKDLSPLLRAIVGWLGDAATELARWGNDSLPKIRENLQPVIDGFVNFINNNGQTIIDIMKGIGEALVVVSAALGAIGDELPYLLGAAGILMLANQLTTLGIAIGGVATNLKKVPKGGIAVVLGLGALAAIAGADSGAGGITGFLKRLLDILTTPWFTTNGTGLFEGWFDGWDWSKIWADIKPGGNWDQAFLDWYNRTQEWWERFTQPFSDGWFNFWAGVDQTWENFKNGFSRNWSSFWGNLNNDWGTNFDKGFNQKWNDFWSGVDQRWEGFKSGFGQKWSSFWGNLNNDWGANFDKGFNQKWSDFWSGVDQKWEGFKSGFGQKWSSFWKSLPGMISSAFVDGGGNLLQGAANNIVDGFLKWLNKRMPDIKGFFQKLTIAIPTWKGPVSRDKTLLENAGTLIMDGFLNGLESRYDAVKKSLGGLSGDIAGLDLGAIPVGLTGVGGRLSAVAGNAAGPASQRILNYYAAPGSSISSEEDLFSAGNRSRMEW